MEKLTVPHKGKNYEFNCYASVIEKDIIFCFTSPDHKPIEGIGCDYFIIKIDRRQPDQIATSASQKTADGLELLEAVSTAAAERFLKVGMKPNYN